MRWSQRLTAYFRQCILSIEGWLVYACCKRIRWLKDIALKIMIMQRGIAYSGGLLASLPYFHSGSMMSSVYCLLIDGDSSVYHCLQLIGGWCGNR